MSVFLTAELVAVLVLLTGALVLVVLVRPNWLPNTAAGKLTVFAALFILPILNVQTGVQLHMNASKSTEFCMACHVMEDYGESMLADDMSMIPANHFQNRRVDPKSACFDCHTQYTMFGDGRAKLTGLRHLYAFYTNQIPETIELYRPYHNRECLHCHIGSRRFEEMHDHDMEGLLANEVGCMECHGKGHEIDQVDQLPKWRGTLAEVLR